MNYGYFDLKNKEYVITNPATPAPWVNYLGSPEYGAIISNNAAGYSFVKSGANGRISRFRFNSNMALPGRFVYIRDNDLTKTKFCKLSKISVKTFNKILNQQANFRSIAIFRIAKTMKIPVHLLFLDKK